ncbi:MAG: HAD hydrolase-like protein [Candidatus Jorgensenbacteria bacterium]
MRSARTFVNVAEKVDENKFFITMGDMNSVRAIIFDWGRTLYDSDTKREYVESDSLLKYLQSRGYKLFLVSLVSPLANATLQERKLQVENSPLRKYFEVALVTDTDKDALFDRIVEQLNLPRGEILIVDDRVVRGIRYGNRHGHPTVWVKQGKFSEELPNADTGIPTYTINSLPELQCLV